MKIAVDSFSFYKHFGRHWFKPEKPHDIWWYCEKCLSLGADGLHIDPYHIDMEKQFNKVMDFADEKGMYVELGACGTSLSELIPYIEAAGRRGVGVLRTFVGGSCLDDRKEIDGRVRKARKDLSRVIPLAEEAGVIIAVENHGDIYMDHLEYLMELNSENIGICYDSGNFAFTGENPVEALEKFFGKIVCTHLKDVCSAGQYPGANPFETVGEPVHFCALGKGLSPIGEIVGKLEKGGIRKITLEICTPVIPGIDEGTQLINEEKAVTDSMEYIHRLF